MYLGTKKGREEKKCVLVTLLLVRQHARRDIVHLLKGHDSPAVFVQEVAGILVLVEVLQYFLITGTMAAVASLRW